MRIKGAVWVEAAGTKMRRMSRRTMGVESQHRRKVKAFASVSLCLRMEFHPPALPRLSYQPPFTAYTSTVIHPPPHYPPPHGAQRHVHLHWHFLLPNFLLPASTIYPRLTKHAHAVTISRRSPLSPDFFPATESPRLPRPTRRLARAIAAIASRLVSFFTPNLPT